MLRSTLKAGAEEGTRTPTPLRVHGPEPCASANSATSALESAGEAGAATGTTSLFYKQYRVCQNGGLAKRRLRNGESGDRVIG
jgi:hypothetical protein